MKSSDASPEKRSHNASVSNKNEQSKDKPEPYDEVQVMNHRIDVLSPTLPWYKDSGQRRLIVMWLFVTSFMVSEFVFGIVTHSLALLADAFHMMSDQIAIMIGFFSIQAGKRKHSKSFSYGWIRAEVIGALINSIFLICTCVFIFIEAIQRFIENEEVSNPFWILIVGGLGLIINLLGLFILRGSATIGHGHSHGHGHQHGHKHKDKDGKKPQQGKLNLHGVFLHMLGDALGSVGAMVTGLGIWLLPWDFKHLLDPTCSVLIAIIILSTSVPLFLRTTKILMQSVPDDIDLEVIAAELMKLKGVESIHELHVWQLADTKIIGTVHTRCSSSYDFLSIATSMKKILHTHGIHSTTIQPEFVDTEEEEKEKDLIQCSLICEGPECATSYCCPETKSPLLSRKPTRQDDSV